MIYMDPVAGATIRGDQHVSAISVQQVGWANIVYMDLAESRL